MSAPPKVGWNQDRHVEGVFIPWWLGLADRDFSTRRVLLLPIPTNLAYSWAIWLVIHVQFPRYVRSLERKYMATVSQKQHESYQKGFEEGVKVGRERAMMEVSRSVDTFLAGDRRGRG